MKGDLIPFVETSGLLSSVHACLDELLKPSFFGLDKKKKGFVRLNFSLSINRINYGNENIVSQLKGTFALCGSECTIYSLSLLKIETFPSVLLMWEQL